MTKAKGKKGVHKLPHAKRTLGQRAADGLTSFAGSWYFIIGLLFILVIWVIFNALALKFRWDPYPFILLNFVLSTLAAVQAPIILMSQNRQTEIDRQRAEFDYTIDRKAEREIQKIHKELIGLRRTIDKYLIASKQKKK